MTNAAKTRVEASEESVTRSSQEIGKATTNETMAAEGTGVTRVRSSEETGISATKETMGESSMEAREVRAREAREGRAMEARESSTDRTSGADCTYWAYWANCRNRFDCRRYTSNTTDCFGNSSGRCYDSGSGFYYSGDYRRCRWEVRQGRSEGGCSWCRAEKASPTNLAESLEGLDGSGAGKAGRREQR